ncbi:hypothetical protein G7081_02870 [Vagococcus coleopterorum]|uniref:LXG domain-containing protein n=1 Tax=Vagococcus coleopterorum TaxID=2714946 RepID=A0A6G8AMC9_9ENTE|nr:hypothetical protein [Vagococcus coleopterorum]QIL46083.1 hypothetical protein G7081_02870 [Vagococcus coleopterorum]
MKPNLGQYVQVINKVVTETEEIGTEMHPYFEEVRTALDTDETKLTKGTLAEVHEKFSEGTAKYKELSTMINGQKPPVKVMGIHKKLEKSYAEYVVACQKMVDAIDPESGKVDCEAFDLSEKEQDDTSGTVAFCIQRMTGLLMK